MSRLQMQKDVVRSAAKLRRSELLLSYRRLNWRVETEHRIYREFEAFVNAARAAKFPIEFRLELHDVPNAGVIQIRAQPSFTGVFDRKYNPSWDGDDYVDNRVHEEEGDLVASLSPTGFVHFIAHPRRSTKLIPPDTAIILLRGLDPAEVTTATIHKALRRYLLIIQGSSLIGVENSLSPKERVLLLWIRLTELRHRYEMVRSLLALKNEWGKIIATFAIPALIAWLVAVLSRS